MWAFVGVVVIGAAMTGWVLRRRAQVSADALRALQARVDAAEACVVTLDAETRRLAREHDRLAVLVRRRVDAHLPQQRGPQRSPEQRPADHPQAVSSPPAARA
ncbi:hypothetical protein ABH931_006542 [Streptacidiphilus sp. MAP12-33]|uniref:hypothetical protein n=1 Tax=Streptacidiphilus sp. MAP12-33 TaxID=3156266 RepID=UPI003513967C